MAAASNRLDKDNAQEEVVQTAEEAAEAAMEEQAWKNLHAGQFRMFPLPLSTFFLTFS